MTSASSKRFMALDKKTYVGGPALLAALAERRNRGEASPAQAASQIQSDFAHLGFPELAAADLQGFPRQTIAFLLWFAGGLGFYGEISKNRQKENRIIIRPGYCTFFPISYCWCFPHQSFHSGWERSQTKSSSC